MDPILMQEYRAIRSMRPALRIEWLALRLRQAGWTITSEDENVVRAVLHGGCEPVTRLCAPVGKRAETGDDLADASSAVLLRACARFTGMAVQAGEVEVCFYSAGHYAPEGFVSVGIAAPEEASLGMCLCVLPSMEKDSSLGESCLRAAEGISHHVLSRRFGDGYRLQAGTSNMAGEIPYHPVSLENALDLVCTLVTLRHQP